jgi:indole-3-acetaldehyde oxidase
VHFSRQHNEPAKVSVINGSYTIETKNGSTRVTGYSTEERLKVDSNDLPIHSRQEMVFSNEYKPVGKPIKKKGQSSKLLVHILFQCRN